MHKFWITRKERETLERQRKEAEARKTMGRMGFVLKESFLGNREMFNKWAALGQELEADLKTHGSPRLFSEALTGRYW